MKLFVFSFKQAHIRGNGFTIRKGIIRANSYQEADAIFDASGLWNDYACSFHMEEVAPDASIMEL